MKALIFSVLALAMTVQAEATCSARTGGTPVPPTDYSRLEPVKASAQQAIRPSVRANGTDSKPKNP